MSWRGSPAPGWGGPVGPGNSLARAARGRHIVVAGASQAGGGGVQAEFEVDQNTVPAAAYVVPAGVTLTYNGASSTTAHHTWQHGPEVGVVATALAAGATSGLRVLTHTAPGTALNDYLGAEWTVLTGEITTATLTPTAIVYVLSPTDASTTGLADAVPNKILRLERQIRTAYGGACGIVLVGTIDTDQPFYAAVRGHGRAWAASPGGLRAYVDPSGWTQQVTTPHLTARGEYDAGLAIGSALVRAGALA